MEPTIYVVLGLSGAGKDTVAKHMADIVPDIVNIKWSDLAKRTYAEWYGVHYEQFADHDKRKELIPGENFSYLDVLIRGYHAWDTIDPKLTVRPTAKQIKNYLEAGVSVVITDTRKIVEADAIIELSKHYPVKLLYIYGRPGEVKRSTDEQLLDIYEWFYDFVDIYTYRNNLSEEELKNFLVQTYTKTEALC